VTKSGTNLLHGDLFEFARHHRFNATAPTVRWLHDIVPHD